MFVVIRKKARNMKNSFVNVVFDMKYFKSRSAILKMFFVGGKG